jgi:hypothetical protein
MSIHDRLLTAALGLALAGHPGHALSPGGYLSNFSSKGPITLTLCADCARDREVLASLIDEASEAEWQHTTPLTSASRSLTLPCGRTVVLALPMAPAPGQPVTLGFQVTQAGQAGECHLLLVVAASGARVEPAAGACHGGILQQAESDVLVFWGFMRLEDPVPAAGAGATAPDRT